MTTQYAVLFSQVPVALNVVIWLAAGMLVGTFQFLTLRWSVRMFAAMQPLPLLLGFQLIRFALVAAMLTAITASLGALPLLVATVGVLINRTIAVRLGAPS